VSGTIATNGGPRHVIPVAAAAPGDILAAPGHVAMRLSDGLILEAAKPGTVVRVARFAGRGFSRAVAVDGL
jgi:hypothetical protein